MENTLLNPFLSAYKSPPNPNASYTFKQNNKHRCKRRQLFIIEVGRDEDWECQQWEDMEAATEDEAETVHVDQVENYRDLALQPYCFFQTAAKLYGND